LTISPPSQSGDASGGGTDAGSGSAAEGEGDVLRRMDLRPLTSRTQLFRIGELLGVCRTSLQGELARQVRSSILLFAFSILFVETHLFFC
jgi:hypothetical protein